MELIPVAEAIHCNSQYEVPIDINTIEGGHHYIAKQSSAIGAIEKTLN